MASLSETGSQLCSRLNDSLEIDLETMQTNWATPTNFCWQVTCEKCGKTGWAGCGRHVEAVMKDVKDEDRCQCGKQSAGSEEL